MPIQRSDSLLLQTRSGWQIPNEVRPERNPVALRDAIDIARGLVPDAVLRSITATYNCVGMVVTSRRTWVDPGDLVRVLRDDGYRRLRGPEEVERGDVVIYHDDRGEPCHVGLVVRKNILTGGGREDLLTVVSKWGGGRRVHPRGVTSAGVPGDADRILDGSEDGMNAAEAMKRIEGDAFSGTVNLASDFRTFLRILESQPEVRALAEEMKGEGVAGDVLARVLELAAMPGVEEYEHPSDAALATYLWLLNSRHPESSEVAADAVLKSKRCWWARKMVEQMRTGKGTVSVMGQNKNCSENRPLL